MALGVLLATAAMLAVLAFVSQGSTPYQPAPLREGPRVMMTGVPLAGAIGPPVSDKAWSGEERRRQVSRPAFEICADQALADTVNSKPGTAPSTQEPCDV